MSRASRTLWIAAFALAAPLAASAQNLIPNGDFSIPGALPGWSLYLGSQQFWDAEDSDLCPASGSAVGVPAVMWQPPDLITILIWWGPCVSLTVPPDAITFGFRVRLEPGSFVPTTTFVGIAYSGDTTCSGMDDHDAVGLELSGDAWQTVQASFATGQGVFSFRPYVSAQEANIFPGESFAIRIDRVLLAEREFVFLDDFEGGSTCRWSSPSLP